MITVSRRDLVLGAAVLLLVAVALVRVAVPDRSRIRPLSIEASWIPGRAVDPGQTVVGENEWTPPDDVYVMGWNPWLGTPVDARFEAELLLYLPERKTTIFIVSQRAAPPGTVEAWHPFNLPPGTGYRALKGRKLRFRYSITNKGTQSFETLGAGALIYFVPVQGN